MAETGSSSNSPAAVLKSRGRMRKGTQSCTECRRRKIRCTFVTGSATCSPCLGRNSRCVDQQQQIFEPFKEPKLQQVAISTAGSQMQRLRSLRSAGDESSDIGLSVSEGDDRAPLVSFLNTTETSDHIPNTEHKGGSKISQNLPGLANTSTLKATSVCQTLRSSLPGYDIIMSTFSQNGAWWTSSRQKSHAIFDAPIESLPAFAARTYTSSNPTELGTLVAAYARSTNQNNRLYALVDSLVISDFAYLATLDGLECLILLAKSYADVGQPRRAWFAWRKGMAVAQLMGFYRAGVSVKRQMLWWAIYHGDRFTGLLLGLPYGFNDAFYSDTMESSPQPSGPPERQLILRCAIIAGKIIDRNISPSTPSFPKTMDLYHQMDTIAAIMPDEWWEISDQPPTHGAELTLVDRLLQQFFFFHVKLYLHLPFLAKSTAGSAYAVSGLACMDASRQMLRIWLILQTKVDGAVLFDCKTSDFLGFMAAVVLLLGLDSTSDLSNGRENKNDRSLIESAWRVFRIEEEEKDCRMASQCRKTLGLLAGFPENNALTTGPLEELHEIRIPYFGTIERKRVKNTPAISVSDGFSAGQYSNHQSPLVSNPSTIPENYAWLDEQGIDYDHEIEYMGQDFAFPTSLGLDGLNDLLSEDMNSMIDLSMMDIDQDWGIFPDI